jgi:LPS-assembly lipoprotein
MHTTRLVVLAAALLLLSGCGFRPLYATQEGGQVGNIGPVVLDTIPGKSGYALQTELGKLLSVERAEGGAQTPKRLSISIQEAIGRVALRVDEASNRADLTLIATYTLYDESGQVLARGRADSIASYEVPINSSFGEVANENDARERAATLLAERIRAELSLRLADR